MRLGAFITLAIYPFRKEFHYKNSPYFGKYFIKSSLDLIPKNRVKVSCPL